MRFPARRRTKRDTVMALDKPSKDGWTVLRAPQLLCVAWTYRRCDEALEMLFSWAPRDEWLTELPSPEWMRFFASVLESTRMESTVL